jgi:hypothetical protein
MSDSELSQLPMPLFLTGQLVATPAALRLLEEHGVEAMDLVARHVYGDWQDMEPSDQVQNLLAVRDGFRVFTSYRLGSPPKVHTIWVVTESDRSTTTLLTPRDY